MADRWICIDAGPCRKTGRALPLQKGAEYVLRRCPSPCCPGGVVALGINIGNGCFAPERFRKAERRNDRLTIEAFLTIKPGQFEEPRRPKAPAKKRERA